MNDYVAAVFISIIAVLLFGLGWITSATTIVHECKKLGGFYVSNSVYECKVKEQKL